LERTPQFVLLTFDDSLDSQFVKELQTLVKSPVRDAGRCPIAVTFFLYNGGTNYTAVTEAHKSAEIACHTRDHIVCNSSFPSHSVRCTRDSTLPHLSHTFQHRLDPT